MSLITHCPACGTTFKVVRDQLKISDGWVRCGQCLEIFDSSPTLRELDLAEVDVAIPQPTSVVENENLDVVLQTIEHGVEHDTSSSLTEFDVASMGVNAVHSELFPDIVLDDPVVAVPDAALPGDFSFITQTSAPVRWHKPVVRGFLLLFSGVLAILLVGQVAVHERDHLASADIRTRPALQRLCELLHCQIQPYQHIEAMMVDSSSFNKQQGDIYRLSFVVKNTADMPLARPAIELTLTDHHDLPVLRRVLLPHELRARTDSKVDSKIDIEPLAGGSEWVGSFLVSMVRHAGETDMAKAVAGYRILAFYP